MKIYRTIRGIDLRPGMVISKEYPKRASDLETVPPFSGKCEKGWHFGQGCYDKCGIWWTPSDIERI